MTKEIMLVLKAHLSGSSALGYVSCIQYSIVHIRQKKGKFRAFKALWKRLVIDPYYLTLIFVELLR